MTEGPGMRGVGKPRRPAWSPRHLASLGLACAIAAVIATFAAASAASAEPSGVTLNEINCTGTDWVEIVNRGDSHAVLSNWLLTDDALDRDPLRDSHRMRFADGTVLAPGARLVVSQGVDGFAFGLSCGEDTVRLADATDSPVDSVTLPFLVASGTTYGRIPDGAGDWRETLPTPSSANIVAADPGGTDPAWLYDPLQVTEIDLEASADALAALDAAPREYVEARITMRNGTSSYGPYLVGLRLKGQASFRPLTGKAAFKVKFSHIVAGQRFQGLKGLTLNNMAQDASMISESTTSLVLQATGAPAARVGYAYVRLNGSDYGLYANVETIDEIMARRFATGTRHIFEGALGADVTPDRKGALEVDEGSTTDLSDLDSLVSATEDTTGDWWDRMQPVADLAEMTRIWAAEHYAGHWDGYSVMAGGDFPHNFYLHSNLAGRFSLIASGTDQTWLERPAFGAYGSGALIRACFAVGACRELYVNALREISSAPAIASLPASARAIRAAIAPWRVLDPRREDTIASGEAQATAKIATMETRATDLTGWLAAPAFFPADNPPAPGSGGSGSSGSGSAEPPPTQTGGTSTPAVLPEPPVRRVALATPKGGGIATITRTIILPTAGTYSLTVRVRGTTRALPMRPGTRVGTRTLTKRTASPLVRTLRDRASVRLRIQLDPLTRQQKARGIELLIARR